MHTAQPHRPAPARCALLAALLAIPAQAEDAATCYTIASADARAWCLARARGEPSQCYAIQDSALRALCLAEVRRQP